MDRPLGRHTGRRCMRESSARAAPRHGSLWGSLASATRPCHLSLSIQRLTVLPKEQ
ncbi:MAG: hypothetical protein F2729_01180 [Actinobacteria bacterium]|nr:hypothetical protein [Actinomycetota bacterium]